MNNKQIKNEMKQCKKFYNDAFNKLYNLCTNQELPASASAIDMLDRLLTAPHSFPEDREKAILYYTEYMTNWKCYNLLKTFLNDY